MADDDPGGWDHGALGDALLRWAADAAAAEAAAARTRERWLRQQAGEEATLTGALVDLAERGDAVTVATPSTAHTGRLVGVGRDFCVVGDRTSVVVALPAIVSVVVAAPLRPGPAGGNRSAPLTLDLQSLLVLLAAERTPARMVLTGGSVVGGVLEAVGEGVARCRVPGPGHRSATVVVAAIESLAPE